MSINDHLATAIDQAATQDTAGVIEDSIRALREVKTAEAVKRAAEIERHRDLIMLIAHKQFTRGAVWMMESLR